MNRFSPSQITQLKRFASVRRMEVEIRDELDRLESSINDATFWGEREITDHATGKAVAVEEYPDVKRLLEKWPCERHAPLLECVRSWVAPRARRLHSSYIVRTAYPEVVAELTDLRMAWNTSWVEPDAREFRWGMSAEEAYAIDRSLRRVDPFRLVRPCAWFGLESTLVLEFDGVHGLMRLYAIWLHDQQPEISLWESIARGLVERGYPVLSAPFFASSFSNGDISSIKSVHLPTDAERVRLEVGD